MSILIPLVCFLLFWGRFTTHLHSTRLAFIYAAALWAVVVAFSTEGLSQWHALTFWPLVTLWSLIFLLSLFIKRPSVSVPRREELGLWSLTDKILISIIVCIAMLKGLSAIFSAPNTADAMTYHLNRVEHWIQNKTVANYPTHVLRQLYTAPWAEYAILHLRILLGSDHFSNAVQWFSAVGSWIAVSLIAQILGASRRGQLTAVLLAATLPMGLVQSTSTQNDYVVTFWMTAFVYLLILLYREKKWHHAVACGCCAGLALLTKGTAYVYIPVWIAIYLAGCIKTKDSQKLKLLGLVLTLTVFINLPFGWRNTATFGSPYWTNVSMVNHSMSLSDFGKTLGNNIKFHLAHPLQQSTGEDDSPNFLHTVVLILFLIFSLILPFQNRKTSGVYMAGVLGMFILLLLIVKDLSWNSRFQLSIFILACTWLGTVSEIFLKRWVLVLGIVAVICSWPWLLKCNEHPFLGDKSILRVDRQEQYFSERPTKIFPYSLGIKLMQSKDCRDIGFIDGENEWGYPWWVLLRQTFGSQFRYEDVGVTNRSSVLSYPLGNFDPCMLVATNDHRNLIILPSGMYAQVWALPLPDETTSIYIKVH